MNCDWILWFVVFVCSNHPHALNNAHTTIYSTKNGVFVIKPRGRFECDKELTVTKIEGQGTDKAQNERDHKVLKIIGHNTIGLTFRLCSDLTPIFFDGRRRCNVRESLATKNWFQIY